MKITLLVSALLASLTLLPGQKPPDAKPQIPRPAENIGIQTGPGQYLWIGDYSGRTLIVACILTTCPHCQFTTGVLNHIAKEYEDKNVAILATAVESMSSLNIPGFKKTFSPVFPVGYNDQNYVAKFLGLPPNQPVFFPQLVFIDRNGIVRAQLNGDDPLMEKSVQEKGIRDTLEKTIREGTAHARQ